MLSARGHWIKCAVVEWPGGLHDGAHVNIDDLTG